MKYSNDQISDMMDNLKPSKTGDSVVSYSILAASGMHPVCNRQWGEDRFLPGCEDSRS